MSWKQGHDCYADDIKVKISERYKPPPRINIAVTYAQRLDLNKQTQDSFPNYDFSTEKKVLENMRDWKSIRSTISQERKTKIEKAREEMKKKEIELSEQEQLEEVELKTVQETATTTDNFITTPTSIPYHTPINQSYVNYSTNNSILVPTQATNHYSNILTPIPLQSLGQQYNCKPNDKSPFNISDFENDTSSPFDNMELKSINDMEQLAQVLNGDKNYETNTPVYSNYQNSQPTPSHMQPYSNYLNNQFSYIPPSVSYVQPPTTDYSQSNGYYFPQNSPLQQQYFYSKPNTSDYRYGTSIPSTTTIESKSYNSCRSVPDIVKALDDELENSHIATPTPKNSFIRTSTPFQTSRPKSTDAVYPRPKIKTEKLDDPFDLLTLTQQEICRSICSMGFPLSRVARTCKIFGDDQKKMVEHLLALSDLLDLGFPEKDVSNALVQCDNDRDKALDKLI